MKRIYFFITILFLSFGIQSSIAQAPPFLGAHIYVDNPLESDCNRFVLATSDGGSLLVGNTTNTPQVLAGKVIKTDASGNELWGYVMSDYDQGEFISAIEVGDGYVVVGNADACLWLVKFDFSGVLLFDNIYCNSGFGGYRATSITTTHGGRILVGGLEISDIIQPVNPPPPGSWSRLFVIEQNGVLNSIHSVNGPGVYKVEKSENNTYYVFSWVFDGFGIEGCNVGGVFFSPFCQFSTGYYSNLSVEKLDANFSPIWYNVYGGDTEDYFIDGLATPDGGFVLVAGTSCVSTTGGISGHNNIANSSDLPYWWLKGNSNGGLQWLTTLGSSGGGFFEVPIGVVNSCDNNLVVGFNEGYTTCIDGIKLAKYNGNNFPFPIWDVSECLSQVLDSRYYLRSISKGENERFYFSGLFYSLGVELAFTLARWGADPDCATNPCSGAIPLPCGVVTPGNTIGQSNSFTISDYTSCLSSSNSFNGPDVVYEITKPSNVGDLSITLINEEVDLDIFLFLDCGSGPPVFLNDSIEFSSANCIASSVTPLNGNLNYDVIIFPDAPAGTYYVVVDGFNASQAGPFSITATCGTLDCSSAIPISCNQTVTGSTLFGANNVSRYCSAVGTGGGTGCTGNEQVYVFQQTSPGEVTIELSGLAPNLDLELFLLSACDPNACIALSTNPNGLNETITAFLNPGTYYIVVDTWGVGVYDQGGSYTLSVNCGVDLCTDWTPLICGNTHQGNTFGGSNNFNGSDYQDCLNTSNGYGGNDQVFRVAKNSSIGDLAINLISVGVDFDIFIFQCVAFNTVCLAYSAESVQASGLNMESVVIPNAPQGLYYIVVDSKDGSPPGPFWLTATCGTLNCSNATPIACNDTLFNQTNNIPGASNRVSNYCGVTGIGGGSGCTGIERIYTFTLNQSQPVTIELTNLTPNADPELFLLGGSCNPNNCIAQSTNPPGEDESISAVLDAGTYYIVVETWGVGVFSPFHSFDLSLICLSAPCPDAIPLPCGVTTTGNTIDAENSFTIADYGSCHSSQNDYDAPDLVYEITKTSDVGDLSISLINTGVDLDIFLLTGCDSGPPVFLKDSVEFSSANCIASSTNPVFDVVINGDSVLLNSESILYQNAPAGTYYIVVDGYDPSQAGLFHLTATCDTLDCSSAIPISCNETLTGNTLFSGVNNVSNFCGQFGAQGGSGCSGNELIYVFELTEQQEVSIDLTGIAPTLDLELFLLDSCSVNSCIAQSTLPAGASENITILLNPGTYYIVVETWGVGVFDPGGSFTLSLSCSGDICSDWTELFCGVTYPGSTFGGSNQFWASAYLPCLNPNNNYSGNDQVFRVTKSSGVGDLAINLISVNIDFDIFIFRCIGGDKECLGYSNLTPAPGFIYNNESVVIQDAEPGDYYIVVDSKDGAPEGPFWITATCGTLNCSGAVPIACNQTLFNQSNNVPGATNQVSNYCDVTGIGGGSGCTGIERIYTFTLNQSQPVTIELTNLTPNADLELFLLDGSCDPNACIAQSTNIPGQNEFISATLAAGTYYIVVETWGVGPFSQFNSFHLSLNCCNAPTFNYNCGVIVCTFSNVPGAPLLFNFDAGGQDVAPGIPWVVNGAEVPTAIGSNIVYDFPGDGFYDVCYPYIGLDGCINYCCESYCIQAPVSCFGSIDYYYNGSTGAWDFGLVPNNAQQISWYWSDAPGTSLGSGSFISIFPPFPCVGRTIVVTWYNPFSGCWETCSRTVYLCNPFECFDFSYHFVPAQNGFEFTLNLPGATNIEWVVDDHPQSPTPFPIGNGFTSDVYPIPGTGCTARTITVTYFWNNQWYICCRTVYLCNPFECFDFSYHYVPAQNGFEFTLNLPGATNIEWVVDDHPQSPTPFPIGSGFTSNVYPIPGTGCTARTITVTYFWNNQWYICCRTVYLCNPFECFDFTYHYVPAQNGFEFTLNLPGATNIEWVVDDHPQSPTPFPIGNGFTSDVYPIPGTGCTARTITVRYFWNNQWYICCRTVYLCNPFDCNLINMSYQAGSGYQFHIDNTPEISSVSWTLDEPQVSSLGSGFSSSFLPALPCGEVVVSVRYWHIPTSTWRICCYRIFICLPSSCDNNITYSLSPGGGLNFATQPNFEQVTWYQEGNEVGSGTSTTVVLPSGTVQNICVQYYDPVLGHHRLCCTEVEVINPADIVHFDIEDEVCGAIGEVIEVPIYVSNFVDVEAFQMSLLLEDPDFGELLDIVFEPFPGSPVSVVYNSISGAMLWFHSSPVTLADNTVIAKIRILVQGNNGSSSTNISFTGSPVSVVVQKLVNGVSVSVPPSLEDGSVCLANAVEICGQVIREDGQPVGNVTVRLLSANGLVDLETVTDIQGNYCFTEVDGGLDYTITPEKDINYLNGVNAGDLSRIQRHILFLEMLDSPYKIIAANAKNPNAINILDVLELQKLILGSITELEDVDSWRFVPVTYVFPDPTQPFNPQFPESITLQGVSQDYDDIDFIGVKIGDVTLSNNPSNSNPDSWEPELRYPGELEVFMNNDVVERYQRVEVPVRVQRFRELMATQFSLAWDSNKLDFKEVNNLNETLGVRRENFGLLDPGINELSFVWFDAISGSLPDSAVLFTIVFEVLAEPGSQTSVTFSPAPTAYYFEDMYGVLEPRMSSGTIRVIEPSHGIASLLDIHLAPNPTDSRFALTLELLTAEDIQVDIYNSTGVPLESLREHSKGGRYDFDLGHLSSGVYLVKISIGDSFITRRIILSK